MKYIQIVTLSFILSGCAVNTFTVTPVKGQECSDSDDYNASRLPSAYRPLISEERISYNRADIFKCTYIKAQGDANGGIMFGGDIVGRGVPAKTVHKSDAPYDIYVVKNTSGWYALLEGAKEKVDTDAKRFSELVEQSSSKEATRIYNVKKYGMICEKFFVDLSNRTNLDIDNTVEAYPAKDGAYRCVGDGVLETPFGMESVQVNLYGNPDSGAYEYNVK